VRVRRALRAQVDDPQRIEGLRAVLGRVRARGLDPEALYEEAVVGCLTGNFAVDRRPPPPYEQVRPDRAAPQS
jgi:hypothetical protein